MRSHEEERSNYRNVLCIYSVIRVIKTMEEVILLTSDVLDVASLSINCVTPFVCALFVFS